MPCQAGDAQPHPPRLSGKECREAHDKYKENNRREAIPECGKNTKGMDCAQLAIELKNFYFDVAYPMWVVINCDMYTKPPEWDPNNNHQKNLCDVIHRISKCAKRCPGVNNIKPFSDILNSVEMWSRNCKASGGNSIFNPPHAY
jgi:hypothetical protein